jgi:DNA-binding response OmpR family regulator
MHVLVAGRDELTAHEIGQLLESKGGTYTHVADEEAIGMLAPDHDVLIFIPDDFLDIETVRELRRCKIQTPFLVLSSDDSFYTKIAYLDEGADDYVVIPFHAEELFVRLRALMRRSRTIIESKVTIGPVVIDTSSKKVTVHGLEIHLTTSEFKMLAYLIRNSNKVIERITLHEAICREDVGLQTVDVLVSKIRSKLANAGADRRLINNARGLGYVIWTQPLE